MVRAILYPGTKVKTASYTFKQAKEIVLKITDDFMLKSHFLREEISKVSTGQNDCYIFFKNRSWIRVCVAGESARGGRSNIIIIDESRMIPQFIVDTILRPMNAAPREPEYLNKPEYQHLQEMNKEFHMSSAYYASSELYDKVKTYFSHMLNPKMKYSVVDLPYQLSIKERLLMREQIANEMSEQTFDEISFSMEREGKFFGSTKDAIFKFNDLDNCRKLTKDVLFDLDIYRKLNMKIPDKDKKELRILSVDIALMGSKKHNNDASALIIHSAIPTNSYNYMDRVVHIKSIEGLTTEELGLMIMRYYYQYDCDYIAIDGNGLGLPVCDYIMCDRYDPEYGQSYDALNCVNNDEMAERCKVKNAPKVIYVIKASSKSNNDMLLDLRAGIQNGYVHLLENENRCDDFLSKIKGYNKLSDEDKVHMLSSFLQTSFLVNEMINLDHDTSNGLIKVKEKSGMRKDRFSSLEYGYYVVQLLSQKLKPKTNQNVDIKQYFKIRKPKMFR